MAKSLILAAAAAILLAAPAAAQLRWIELGSREVSDRAERDVIAVPGRALYGQVRLCVERTRVRFYDVDVRFRNGGNQSLPVRALVARGACSRSLDLRGRRRDIESVTFTYEAASLGRRRARVRLLAI